MVKGSIACSALIIIFGLLNCIIALGTENFDAGAGWFVAITQAGCNIIANLTILNKSK